LVIEELEKEENEREKQMIEQNKKNFLCELRAASSEAQFLNKQEQKILKKPVIQRSENNTKTQN